MLIDKDISKTELRCRTHISTNAMAELGKNESVSLETLSKICSVLDCEIGDVVQLNQGLEVGSNQ